MKMLNVENPFFQWMGWLCDMAVLNLLFVATSIPVVTAGAGMLAMHEVFSLREDEERDVPVVRTYFHAFARNLKKGLFVWTVLLLGFAWLFVDLYLVGHINLGSFGPLLLTAIGCLFCILVMVADWVFPVALVWRGSLGGLLKESLIRAVCFLPITALLTAVNAIPFAAAFLPAVFIVAVMPLYVVVGFSLSAYLTHRLVQNTFEKDAITIG